MTQTLYFIAQNGQPISMETWTDKEKAQAYCDALNLWSNKPYEVRSRVSSDNASEATPIKIEMGKPETKCS